MHTFKILINELTNQPINQIDESTDMKYWTLLIVGLLLFTNCQTESTNEAAQESEAIINAAQSDSKVKTYDGLIEGKFSIEVELVTEGNLIQGFYLNRKSEILLPIKGIKRDDNSVELAAYDETGGTVELFVGEIKDNAIVGEWFDKRQDGTAIAKFTFSETSETLPQEDILTFKGTYEYEIDGYTSYLIIEPIGNKTVKIQMMTVYGSCTGDIHGEAFIYDANHINYFGEDNCFLNIYFENNAVLVSEMACNYYHGFKCNFDGKYTKVSEELNWIISG
jgi:hypothetical protein